MDAIQVTARLTIHEGKLEEFKELAAQCMRSVRERDSGTAQYDWFFGDNHRNASFEKRTRTPQRCWSTLQILARPWGQS
jgi:quinol monooxygenase YgiN